MADVRVPTLHRFWSVRPVALSAAVALACAPLTLPLTPAAAAESVSFLDENPDDGQHVFSGAVNLLVTHFSINDHIEVTVDGVGVPDDDLEAWVDLSPEIGEDATDEEWDQAIEDFMSGTPMDAAVELIIYADVPAGAELTVTIDGVSATNTMLGMPEWTTTGPTRVYTDDLKTTGLPASGVIAPATLPNVEGAPWYTSFFVEENDFQEPTKMWVQSADRSLSVAADGSFDSSLAPDTEYIGFDMEWFEELPEEQSATLAADAHAVGGVAVSFARDGGGAASASSAASDDTREVTGDPAVDAQLNAVVSWYLSAVEDGTLKETLEDEIEDEEIATLSEVSQRDGLDHGLHMIYGEYAGGWWEFIEEETGGAFAVRHGSAPGDEPSPGGEPSPAPTPTDAPSPTASPSASPTTEPGPSQPVPSADPSKPGVDDGTASEDRADKGRLPRTGAEFAGPALIGGLLVAAGVTALVIARRRTV